MAETVPGMAEAVAARMNKLGLSPTELERASGLSNPQCLDVREGRRKRYMHKTRLGIARAFRWPLDWYDRLLDGEDASTFPDTDHPLDLSLEERLSALEQKVQLLADQIEQAEPR